MIFDLELFKIQILKFSPAPPSASNSFDASNPAMEVVIIVVVSILVRRVITESIRLPVMKTGYVTQLD